MNTPFRQLRDEGGICRVGFLLKAIPQVMTVPWRAGGGVLASSSSVPPGRPNPGDHQGIGVAARPGPEPIDDFRAQPNTRLKLPAPVLKASVTHPHSVL